jgi:recombinational DNA repair protein (RecF pathway)
MTVKCENCGKDTNFTGFDPYSGKKVCMPCYIEVLNYSEEYRKQVVGAKSTKPYNHDKQ